MAKEIKIDIPIKVGKGKSDMKKGFLDGIKNALGNFGQSNKKSDIGTNIGKIATSVGIVATIWKGIQPILTPVLKMFSLLLTLLLLPLIPVMKQMMSGLAKTMKKTRESQKEAGGGTAGFLAGVSTILSSPTIWAFAGAGLALSFAKSLGTTTIAGTLATLISASIIWETITSGDEETIAEKLKTSGWAGLSAGIAALMFGAGIYALPIGALVFSLNLGLEFLTSSFAEEDLKTALLEAAGGSLMMGLVAGGVVALLGLGIGAAAVTTISVGTILFSAFAAFKIGGKIKEETEMLTKEMEKQKEELSLIDKAWGFFGGTVMALMKNDLIPGISTLGFLIGSPTKGSFPIVYSLKKAEDEWVTMKDVSMLAINEIIQNLDKIPRSITTTHYIRTVKL